MASGGVASTGCCCQGSDCPDQDYYVLYTSCGSKYGPGSCTRLSKTAALAAGFKKGDHIRTRHTPPYDTFPRRSYIVGCEGEPPGDGDCGQYGADTQCLGPDQNYGSGGPLTSADAYIACSQNSCEGCRDDGSPPSEGDVPGAWQLAWNTCDDLWDGCAGNHWRADDYTPPMDSDDPASPIGGGRCLDITIDDVSFAATSPRYENYSIEAQVSRIDIGFCFWDGADWQLFGNPYGWSSLLIIDYTISYDGPTEPPDCCDLSPFDPGYCGDDPCCDPYQGSSGRRIMHLSIDMADGDEYGGTNGLVCRTSLNLDSWLLEAANLLNITNETPGQFPACGENGLGNTQNPFRVTQTTTGFVPPRTIDECLDCNIWNSTGNQHDHFFQIVNTGLVQAGGGLSYCGYKRTEAGDICENTGADDGFRMTVTFSVNDTGPTRDDTP